MRRKTNPNLRKILIDAINASGLSRYEIARRSGLPQSSFTHLFSGRRHLSMRSLDKLFPVLGLEVRKVSTRKED